MKGKKTLLKCYVLIEKKKEVLTGNQEVAFANFTSLVVFLKENLS